MGRSMGRISCGYSREIFSNKSSGMSTGDSTTCSGIWVCDVVTISSDGSIEIISCETDCSRCSHGYLVGLG